ncbi:MAG TPA: sialidase family protein [Blastocatellia bacterium]|nr:sialidase family protein [Blastocatellia bacterium]
MIRALTGAGFVSVLLVVLWAAHAGNSQTPSIAIHEIDSPAGSPSGEPNLATDPSGRIYLTWIEKKGEKAHALRFAVLTGNSWSQPKTIVEAENLVVNWADFPSIAPLTEAVLVAHWLVKSSPDGHAYDINIARSTDGGRTWSKPITPHTDGTKTEHGFVAILPGGNGRTAAIWLDGRNFNDTKNGGHGVSANEMTLRFAAIDPAGKVSEGTVLDPRVCDCCQTSAAPTSEGPIVVYRDRSEREIRDISIIRFNNGRWTEPRTLSADGWEIQGCPVNGPSVSADGRQVAVAWFTAAKQTPRVNLVFSSDAGATFGQPIQVDEGNPMGRVDVQMLSDRSALVSWLERTASGAEVKVRRIKPAGIRDETVTVATSSAARTSGFPQMARGGDRIVFAWTDPRTSRVRTASARWSRKDE